MSRIFFIIGLNSEIINKSIIEIKEIIETKMLCECIDYNMNYNINFKSNTSIIINCMNLSDIQLTEFVRNIRKITNGLSLLYVLYIDEKSITRHDNPNLFNKYYQMNSIYPSNGTYETKREEIYFYLQN